MTDIAEIRRIADAIWAEGYRYAEAYPVTKWRRNGWPELTKTDYALADAYLRVHWLESLRGGS